MNAKYQRALARLRALRLTAGLTLKQVEIKSRGDWKSAVVGSYERGTRHLSLLRALELCEFYGGDLGDLGGHTNESKVGHLTFDLRRLAVARLNPDELSKTLFRFLTSITSKRGDYNGEILSLRQGDLETLQLLTELKESELIAAFRRRDFLLASKN